MVTLLADPHLDLRGSNRSRCPHLTLDRYGHLYDGLDAPVADQLDDLLPTSRGLPAASTRTAAEAGRLF